MFESGKDTLIKYKFLSCYNIHSSSVDEELENDTEEHI